MGGVYFASDARYICSKEHLSPPGPRRLRYMYYVRVLVGDYTTDDNSCFVCYPPNKGTSNERYDSVVDNVANPNEYVIFRDFKCYPEYLITFRQLYD